MTTEKDDESVFRAEALQHKREGWFGPSRLHVPSGLTIFLITGLITGIFTVSIITFGSYSERINVTGMVAYDPPAVALMALRDGIITRSSAFEGTIIKRGQLVFTVSSDIHTNLGPANVEMMALLKKQRDALSKKLEITISNAQKNSLYLASKTKIKQQEINSLEALIQESEIQKEWFAEKSRLYTHLRKKGIALDSDLIDRRKDYYLSAESLSSSKVRRITLQGELLELQKQASSVDRDLNEKKESFIIELATIDQRILDAEKNKEYLIVAPFDGVITSVSAHIGERVTAGQRIAVLVPQGATAKVELLSPSDSIGEVVRGLQVKMRVAAYPYQWYGKIRGAIEAISVAPVNMTSPAQAKSDYSGKGLFRIIVTPELTEQQLNISLLPGMEVEAEIYVKTRKVYQWLFIPVRRAYERATDSME
ncbi:membrane fusion protein [Erwinia toletana]|uniref:Membrane fusion protein n=1 Tax=Winslowiella toletana TaxID=92490 RepID=A0ABS4PAD1_9GAMM|nr:HlyD family efflux transporter periplasmic adaptor subunit [Winslowiella toletana]MBP2169598.1 membrane fusion protein [Winslowiella toletana]